MKKNELMKQASGFLNKVGFQLKKSSPTLFVVAGVIGIGAGIVTACCATTKATKVVEKAKEDLNDIHEVIENEAFTEEYTKEDAEKAVTAVYVNTGVKLIKLYAPSVAIAALSIASVIWSNRILKKRNIAIAAAYKAVDTGFKQYQDNVIDRFGEKVHKELKYNIKKKEVEETVTDEDGNETVVKKTIEVVDPAEFYSPYAKIFDELNDNYEPNPEYNLMFLRAQQAYANDLLRSRGKGGRLFLNEVYDMLGFERTKAGQRVGWIYDTEDPIGDGYVDFGIYNINSPSSSRFLNGYEPAIILDFNVDGDIWEDM